MRRHSIALAAAASMLMGPAMALSNHNELILSPNYCPSGSTKAKSLKAQRYRATKSQVSIRRKHRHNAKRKAA